MIISHRGGIEKYQQNSISSFIDSILNSFDGIEFDVRESSDRIFVVVHDDRIGGNLVSQMSCVELNKMGVITLHDMLMTLKSYVFDYGVTLPLLNLEIKPWGVSSRLFGWLRNWIVENGGGIIKDSSFIITSFLHSELYNAYKKHPYFRIGFIYGSCPLVGSVLYELSQCGESGVNTVIMDREHLTKDYVCMLVNSGVIVWCYTVNVMEEFLQLRLFGVTGLITDVPLKIKNKLYINNNK